MTLKEKLLCNSHLFYQIEKQNNNIITTKLVVLTSLRNIE